MIQDYFSVDKKGDDYYLVRIINKVDFEEEVVWARDFVIKEPSQIDEPIESVLRYLSEGFDSLEKWTGDQEGFHSSIKHFGFENILRSDTLVPQFIAATKVESSAFNKLFFEAIAKSRQNLSPKTLDTKAGILHESLKLVGAKTFKPKDPEAIVPVPLKWMFEKDHDQIGALLENYS